MEKTTIEVKEENGKTVLIEKTVRTLDAEMLKRELYNLESRRDTLIKDMERVKESYKEIVEQIKIIESELNKHREKEVDFTLE